MPRSRNGTPSKTLAKKPGLGTSLSKIRRLSVLHVDELLLVPLTWQFISDSLGFTSAPWHTDLGLAEFNWSPSFRGDFKRKSTLEDLQKLVGFKDIKEAKLFLLTHFSGASLEDLLGCVIDACIATPKRRKYAPWWELLPIPTPSRRHQNRYDGKRHQNRYNRNSIYTSPEVGLTGETQRAFSHFRALALERLDVFFSHKARDKDVSATSNHKDATGLFFALSGTLHLAEDVRTPLVNRAMPYLSDLITSVSFESQEDPAAIEKHLRKNLDGEVLHASHAFMGKLQEDLIGRMVMAEFPLKYWEILAGGARPTQELPKGRRQEFSDSESAAIFKALYESVSDSKRRIAQALESSRRNSALKNESLEAAENRGIEVSLRKKEMTLATRKAGRIGFEHISTILLCKWVDECKRLLAYPELNSFSGGLSTEECLKEHAYYVQEILRIQSLLHLILAKNHGLSGSIHKKFVKLNDTFHGHHDSRDVASLINEEMLKAAASFDYTTNLRFSTYAVNRVSMELRRRPHQERQLIKLSPDQTTAQPRIFALAQASEKAVGDPDYYGEIADKYNELFGEKGRARFTPSQVEDLLRVGKMVSIGPARKNGQDENSDQSNEVQIADDSPRISAESLAEVGECVSNLLKTFEPSDEFTLSVLLRVSPPAKALKRFTSSLTTEASTRIARLIQSKSITSAQTPPPGRQAQRLVKVAACNMSERSVRSKNSEEIARQGGPAMRDGDDSAE